jgi:hypothetical protein
MNSAAGNRNYAIRIITLLILALLLTMVINLVYKFTTDQAEMKRLKSKIKGFQKEMRENKDDVKKMQKIQAEAMQVNMAYTMKSLKPTLFTFIPLIIIFAWMNANLAFEAIHPGDEFQITMQLDKLANDPVEIITPTEVQVLSENPAELKEQTTGLIFKKKFKIARWNLTGEEGKTVLNFKHDGQDYSREVI